MNTLSPVLTLLCAATLVSPLPITAASAPPALLSAESPQDTATPAAAAAALLRGIADVERILQQNGGNGEALKQDCHRVNLLCADIAARDDAANFARAMERILLQTPGAAAAMEQHLKLTRQHLTAASPNESKHSLKLYEYNLRRLIIHRMPALTVEGRQEQAAIRAFLTTHPQAVLGELKCNWEKEPRFSLWCDEQEGGRYYPLEPIPEGGFEEARALADLMRAEWGYSMVLLAFDPADLRFDDRRKLYILRGVKRSDLHHLPGGAEAVQRALEEEPELRARIRPLPTAAATKRE